MLVDGQVVRWCQQCCCFHELSAFDDDKRCRSPLTPCTALEPLSMTSGQTSCNTLLCSAQIGGCNVMRGTSAVAALAMALHLAHAAVCAQLLPSASLALPSCPTGCFPTTSRPHRNCRERLVMHNERRNKRKVLSQAAAREDRGKERPQRLGPNGAVLPAGPEDIDDEGAAAGGEQSRPKRTRVPVRRLGADGDGDDSGLSDDDDVDSGNSLSFSRRSATASRSPSSFHRTSLSRSANAFARDSGVSVGGGHSPFSRLSGSARHALPGGGTVLNPLDDVVHAPTRPRSQTPARAPAAAAAGTGAAAAGGGLEALMAAAEQEAAAAQQPGESAAPRGAGAAVGGRGGAFQAPPRSSGTFQPIVTPQQALSVQQLWDSAVAEQRDGTIQAAPPHQPQPWKYARPLPAPMPLKHRSSAPDLLSGGGGVAGRLHTGSNTFQRDSGTSDMSHVSHFTLANALAAAFPAGPAAAAAQHQQGSGFQPPSGGFVTRSVPRMPFLSALAGDMAGRNARDDSPPSDETVAAPLSARSSYNSAGPSVMDLSPWGGLKTGSSPWVAAAAALGSGGQPRLPGAGEGAAQQQPQVQSPRDAPAPLTVRAPPTNAFGGIARRGEPAAEAASVLAAAQRRAGKADNVAPFSAPAAGTAGTVSAFHGLAAMPQLGPPVQRPVALMPRPAGAAGLGYSNAAADTTQHAQQAVTALINNALLEALLRNKAEQVLRAQQQQQLNGALLAALNGAQGPALTAALLEGRLGGVAAPEPAALAPIAAAAAAIGPPARSAKPSDAYLQWVGIMRASLIASPVSISLLSVDNPHTPL